MRHAESQQARKKPCSANASRAYSEQLGVNLQPAPGPRIVWMSGDKVS
jgi:hypothetical protein